MINEEIETLKNSDSNRNFWRAQKPKVFDTLEPERNVESDSSLAALIDRVLDKGLVINADITVSVSGTELLGIKIRAALASFETAAQYGLQFPSGTNMQTAAWRDAMVDKEECPQCTKKVDVKQLLNKNCPWCGWQSAKAKASIEQQPIIQKY